MKNSFQKLAEKRISQSKLAEKIGENIRKLKAMSDDDIKYVHNRDSKNFVLIWDFFGVSQIHFCSVIEEEDRKSEVFARYRGNRIGELANSIHLAFLYRKLNENEYSAIEKLIPEVKKLDAKSFTDRETLDNGYERVYADLRLRPDGTLIF